MSIMDKLAAQRARINDMKATMTEAPAAPQPPEGWTYLGERNGKPHYRTTPGVAVVKPRTNPVLATVSRLPIESPTHTEGDTCPHCLGSGRYSAHRGHFHNEKCYRCDGKGVLNAKDLAFLERRMKGAGPLCLVVSA